MTMVTFDPLLLFFIFEKLFCPSFPRPVDVAASYWLVGCDTIALLYVTSHFTHVLRTHVLRTHILRTHVLRTHILRTHVLRTHVLRTHVLRTHILRTHVLR